MKKLFVLLLLSCVGMAHLHAQVIISNLNKDPKNTIYMGGRICNSFTHAAIDSAFVTLMQSDSTVIDTMSCKMVKYGGETTRLFYHFSVPRQAAKYILKVEAENYETTYKDYEVKYIARNRSFEIPDILMQKIFAYDQSLDEVEVVATKVQMVFKGDTIVYNADAFNVPEGSMLDVLIRQMPGVELNENGEIKVNGRKIDKLTLNGDDFMRGDNNTLLKNLPYYTVKDIQVFNKTAEQDEGRDFQTAPKDYVMNVRLKKEYNRGFLGNVEVGGGTHDRYMSRFFGMMFTDLTKVSVFGNLNNVNENRHPGENGDWDARKEPQGIRNFKNVGVNVNTKNREDRVRDSFNADLSWTKTEDESRFAATNYLDETRNFSRRQNTAMSHNTGLRLNNNLIYLRQLRIFNNTTVTIGEGDNTSFSRSALFLNDPEIYGNTIAVLDSIYAKRPKVSSIGINRNLNRGFGKTKTVNLSNFGSIEHKLPWGDYVHLSYQMDYSANDNKDLNLMQVDYLQGELSGDFRNRYTLDKGHNYSFSVVPNYRINIANNTTYFLGYHYDQEYKRLENPLYRLDYLDGWGYQEDIDYSSNVYDLGILPAEQQLLSAIDASNSVYSGLLSRSQGPTTGLSLFKEAKKFSIFSSVSMNVNYKTDHLHYERGSILADNQRHYWAPLFSMNIYANSLDYKKGFSLEAIRRVTPSDVVSMVNYVDDTNPLAIRMGNPNLKNGANDRIHLYIWKRKDKHHLSGSFYITYIYHENDVVQGYTYNRNTGAYTYKPLNVNGNNELNTGFHLTTGLGKKDLFTFNSHTDLSFRRYVQMALLSGATEAAVFSIHGSQASQRNDITYKKGDLTLTVGGEFHLKHNESRMETFNNNTLYEFNYGITAQYKLPLDVYIATDVKISNIRGMEDKSLNVDQVVWNGKLSRSFCKGKLTAVLEGYDILGKLKNIQYYVNSEGATSYWVRSIPSYGMLHLQYRLNIQPKKKKN